MHQTKARTILNHAQITPNALFIRLDLGQKRGYIFEMQIAPDKMQEADLKRLSVQITFKVENVHFQRKTSP